MKCCHYSFFIKKSKQDYIKKDKGQKQNGEKKLPKKNPSFLYLIRYS